MAKKSTTSYNVSVTLRDILTAKGIMPTVDVNQTYYEGASQVHLLIADMSDGTYRCVVKTTSGIEFDFHSVDDPTYIREWTVRELYVLIGSYPGVEANDFTQQGGKYVYRIRHNGRDFAGEDQNQANAQAFAFINLLNAQA